MPFYSYSQSTSLAPYEGWRIWIGLMTEFINLSKQTNTNNFLVSEIIISQQQFNTVLYIAHMQHCTLSAPQTTSRLQSCLEKAIFSLKSWQALWGMTPQPCHQSTPVQLQANRPRHTYFSALCEMSALMSWFFFFISMMLFRSYHSVDHIRLKQAILLTLFGRCMLKTEFCLIISK